MMTKKDFKELADMIADVEDDSNREFLINRMCVFCYRNNSRFDESRFKEWIRRTKAGESHKGIK